MSDQKKFRITLWAVDTTAGTTGGWRGEQKAVVFDASAIGVEENANDVGSAFWTLPNNHPQITEFVPLARHYEIARWSGDRNRWEFVGAGILNDYSVTEWETTFQGIDYKAVLNQVYTPLTQMGLGSPEIVAAIINKSEQTSHVAFTSDEGTSFVSTSDMSVSLTTQTANFDYYITNGYWLGGNNNNKEYQSGGSYIGLRYTATWVGATTSGMADYISFAIYASPPGYADIADLPVGNTGLIGVYDAPRYSSFTVNDGVDMYSAETSIAMAYSTSSFYGTSAVTRSLNYDPNHSASTIPEGSYGPACPLRLGVTYTFQVYAAILRTSTNVWYRSASPVKTFEYTLGQSNNTAGALISDVFNNAKTYSSYSRIRSSSLSVIGTSVTTHTVFSSGTPSLEQIANICDLEMGAKTNGDKVVFALDKPTGGSQYSGNFLLKLSVSSAASTSIALRYPENIRSFSFTPGYSRVRNSITVIPTDKYLTGSTGQNAGGTSLIGASAVDTSSQSSNGIIPLVVTKAGFINEQAAQNEANRLINTYKVANSKQVGIRAVLDGIDLWNGWDVGDSIRVTINQGLAVVDEPFVIAGVRWFGESDGHERVELDLVQGSAFAAAYTVPPTTTAT